MNLVVANNTLISILPVSVGVAVETVYTNKISQNDEKISNFMFIVCACV